LISEYTPLFGFMESGYRLAVVLALLFDALTTIFLTIFLLALAWVRSHPRPAQQPAAHDRHSGQRASIAA
jgi:hypothetical protein